MTRHDPLLAITRAALGAQAAHRAHEAAERATAQRAAARLAAAETTLANQRQWAAEQWAAVAAAVTAGAERLPGEVDAIITIAPPAALLPDARAGLLAAAGKTAAGLRDIEEGGRSLLLWKTRRSSLIAGAGVVVAIVIGLIALLGGRAVAQARDATAAATAQFVAQLTEEAGAMTAEAKDIAAATASSATATQAAADAQAAAEEATRDHQQRATAAAAAAAETATAAAILTEQAPTPFPDLPLARTVTLPGGLAVSQLYVPAGSFTMGSTSADPAAKQDEFPARQVSLNEFWIDRTEVTNAQFSQFLNAQGNQSEGGAAWINLQDPFVHIDGGGTFAPKAGYADYPVTNVSWYGARNYCDWAGGRLPTEAEWEYAARGPQGNLHPWGDAFSCGLANLDDETQRDPSVGTWGRGCDGFAMTSPVGAFPGGASWVGAVDMIGNVYEWVADWYAAGAYAGGAADNPPGPADGTERVLRGSAWNMEESEATRSAHRLHDAPANRRDFVGFRCVSD